ncbi:MAG TPA: DUF3124 domain-containing protein [Methylomicrobium sp.]|nr:DUF3124 domain-containing protein [Methylomicrobium sp.]
MKNFRMLLIAVVCTANYVIAPCYAFADAVLSKGQTIYVPVYSNIFTAPKAVPVHLANILAIRNTDLHNVIRVTSVDYYDTKGALVKKYYPTAVTLSPLETTHVYLSERDDAGGFGANFIVRWQANKEVNPPIIECLMAGREGRGFISPGQVISEDTK